MVIGRRVVVGIASVAACAPAGAVPVTLTGTITNSCTLAVSTSGVLVVDSAATAMRSDSGVGARAATLTIAALGTSPTLTFGAPTLSAPAGFTADSVQFSYSVAGSGASRGFAATGGTAASNLIDTLTIHGLVQSASGFPSGSYTETINVTCG